VTSAVRDVHRDLEAEAQILVLRLAPFHRVSPVSEEGE
jgi:hypothetical protein